jgi:hypothetical protein
VLSVSEPEILAFTFIIVPVSSRNTENLTSDANTILTDIDLAHAVFSCFSCLQEGFKILQRNCKSYSM